MHMGDVQQVHLRQGGLVHGCAADDKALFCAGSLRRRIGLLEGIHAGDFRDGFSAQVQDDVPTPRQRPHGQGKIRGAPHDDGKALGGALEILQIGRNVPRKSTFHANFIILADGHNQTFLHRLVNLSALLVIPSAVEESHTATGALMAGQGSYPSSVKSSYLKSNTDLTSGFRRMTGSFRGSRDSCRATCSK